MTELSADDEISVCSLGVGVELAGTVVTGSWVVRSREVSVGLKITGSFVVSEAMELSGTEGIVVVSRNVNDGATELSTSVEITGSRVEIVETNELSGSE